MRHAKKAITALLPSCMVVIALAQQRPVSGTVLNNSGTALSGATINVKKTTRSVSSDEKGLYSIPAKTGETLVKSPNCSDELILTTKNERSNVLAVQ